jgi:cytochrome c-type biogenesis protein CcmF
MPIWDKLEEMVAKGEKPPVSVIGPGWWHNGLALFGFLVAALSISTALWLFIDGARKRAAARDESFGAALWAILSKARSQTGGYMTHLGVGIVLVGLIGSAMYVDDRQIKLEDQPGAKFEVDRYEFTYQRLDEQTLANGDQIATAQFTVTKDGKPSGTLSPGQTSFASQGKNRLDADVRSEVLRDIFIVLQGIEGDQLSLNVKINPLISFAWLGFALMMIGTAIAAWPRQRPVAAVQPAADRPGRARAKR